LIKRRLSMRIWISALLWVALAAVGCAATAEAQEPCSGFKWDVSKELALFGGASTAVTAAKDAAAAPTLDTDKLYQVTLVPQSGVAFALAPAKKTYTDKANGGLVTIKLPASGNYRVSVDASLWLDVVDNGALATVRDYQGQPTCDAPHKIVEFALSGTHVTLQLSGSSQPVVRVTVTLATPQKVF
jgi:hypothetical protein